MSRWHLGILVLLISTALLALAVAGQRRHESSWTTEDLDIIGSLWIGTLEPLSSDLSNRYADDSRAVELGHRLFFDKRLSRNGEVACATCHAPALNFTDGLPLSQGVGSVPRKSMTITGTAHSPWLFWDGRKDSQWAQALAPFESPVEHGTDRGAIAHVVHQHYGSEYEALFGPLPDLANRLRFPENAGPVDDAVARANWQLMHPEDRESVTRVFVNVGKALAAYERQIMPGPARFDRYVEALLDGGEDLAANILGEDETSGLRLFLGRAKCIDCHSGPLFTNNSFHNIGVPTRPGLQRDMGRALGARQVIEDEFNCLSAYSDAEPNDCAELRFLKVDGHEHEGAFKPPTLRNVAETAPYMHAGQFSTLAEVLEHYNHAPAAVVGHSELEPLQLTGQELMQLEAFLRGLSGPLAAPAELLRSPFEPADP